MPKKVEYSNNYYIYEISHPLLNKVYIGYRRLPLNLLPDEDTYMGSSCILLGRGKLKGKSLFNKYGKDTFKKRILLYLVNVSKNIAEYYEKLYIKNARNNNIALFNISDGGTGGNLGKEVAKIQSKKRLGKSPWNKGLKLTEEQKIKYGYYKPKKFNYTLEIKQKKSIALKKAWKEGRKVSSKGYKHTNDVKQKWSENWYKNRNFIYPYKILNITTNEIFENPKELLKKYPQCTHFKDVCLGKRKKCHNFEFKFIER